MSKILQLNITRKDKKFDQPLIPKIKEIWLKKSKKPKKSSANPYFHILRCTEHRPKEFDIRNSRYNLTATSNLDLTKRQRKSSEHNKNRLLPCRRNAQSGVLL